MRFAHDAGDDIGNAIIVVDIAAMLSAITPRCRGDSRIARNERDDRNGENDSGDSNGDRPINAGINPNVGWAKQVRHAITAGAIEATICIEKAISIYPGTCFAPT